MEACGIMFLVVVILGLALLIPLFIALDAAAAAQEQEERKRAIKKHGRQARSALDAASQRYLRDVTRVLSGRK